MFTTRRFWVGTLSIMQFGNIFTFKNAFIFVGFSIHSANWFVQIRTTTRSLARTFSLKTNSCTSLQTLGLISHIISSTYRTKAKGTVTWSKMRLKIRNSAWCVIGHIDSGTLSQFTKILVSNSIGTTYWIVNLIAYWTVSISSLSISVFRNLVTLDNCLCCYFLLTPTL